MAHYREMTVAGKNYRFHIGFKFTEIRNEADEKSIFENCIIGNPHVDKRRFIVTPLNVRRAILGRPVPEYECTRHGVKTTVLATNPYASEIYGRKEYMVNCPECLANLRDDI